jgi:hypothetical protein
MPLLATCTSPTPTITSASTAPASAASASTITPAFMSSAAVHLVFWKCYLCSLCNKVTESAPSFKTAHGI